VGLLAGLLFVRRTVEEPDVFSTAAFLAGVALDVLASEIRERLCPTFLDLPLAGILPTSRSASVAFSRTSAKPNVGNQTGVRHQSVVRSGTH
jgi:hypothetical protein